MYTPNPINTDDVSLSTLALSLVEKLAENAHDVWAKQRMEEGWTYGKERNDTLKTNPCLVPYSALSDAEKEYDRNAAIQTIKALIKLTEGVDTNE